MQTVVSMLDGAMVSKRYVSYLRVSTPKQGENGLGVEAQREAVRRFPVSFVPFDIRPEHPLAPTETACSSNSREETTATPVRPALRLAPASAIPGSGSSRSCPALTQLRSHTNRMRAFLGYRSIIDHQHGIAAANQPIRLNKQFRLHRPRIPDPSRNEVVQLIVFAKPKPLRHGLNALAIARTDQPRHVEWTHLSPRLVTQPIQKRLEKAAAIGCQMAVSRF